tara:strand:+ start:1069 stop:1281 length:213 start_codon:yes stop_codon:yes gene_type:complete
MKQMFDTVNGWVAILTEILSGLVVLAIVTGILFDDPFGVIANISMIMGDISDSGLAGLVALILVALWYKK